METVGQKTVALNPRANSGGRLLLQSEIVLNKKPLPKDRDASVSSISKSGKKRKTPKIETIDVYTKNPAGERQVQKFLFEPKG